MKQHSLIIGIAFLLALAACHTPTQEAKRMVRTQSQGLKSSNMQCLASGQYLMKVFLEGGKAFSDKVVKE